MGQIAEKITGPFDPTVTDDWRWWCIVSDGIV